MARGNCALAHCRAAKSIFSGRYELFIARDEGGGGGVGGGGGGGLEDSRVFHALKHSGDVLVKSHGGESGGGSEGIVVVTAAARLQNVLMCCSS